MVFLSIDSKQVVNTDNVQNIISVVQCEEINSLKNTRK
jgi:hypothetical protein